MDFITVPLTVGVIAFLIYKFFELLICRKERLLIVDKIDSGSMLEYVKQLRMGVGFGSSVRSEPALLSYPASWSLRIGSLIFGMGFGLVLGTVLNRLVNCNDTYWMREMLIGGSVLCLGGLGLLVAFIVEYRLYKKPNA